MGKPYSLDFRKRAVTTVVTGGLSCNQVAKQFGVVVSTAVGWVRGQREAGSLAPGKMGGHRPKTISGEHRVCSWKESSETSPCAAWSSNSLRAG
jgi:transposase